MKFVAVDLTNNYADVRTENRVRRASIRLSNHGKKKTLQFVRKDIGLFRINLYFYERTSPPMEVTAAKERR